MIELLLSKDLSRVSELDWISQGPARFLDNSVEMTGNKVGLVSFMRSGNTFLKRFIEQITGVTTGSELRRDITLQCAGLMGEGHGANNRVWLSKSHHPITFKRSKEGVEDQFCYALPINK